MKSETIIFDSNSWKYHGLLGGFAVLFPDKRVENRSWKMHDRSRGLPRNRLCSNIG